MGLFASEVFTYFSLVGSCCVKNSRFPSISDPILFALCAYLHTVSRGNGGIFMSCGHPYMSTYLPRGIAATSINRVKFHRTFVK